MANINQHINEMRLNTHYNKIQQRLTPAAINNCRQIALSLTPKIQSFFFTSDGERQLVKEIISQIRYKNLGSLADADINAMVFIVLMEAAKSAREDLKGIMQGVKNINEQKKSHRERLQELMEEVSDESEGKYRRYPPLTLK